MILTKTATVEFNPAIKAHRAAVKAFFVRNAWVDSPFRFSHDPAYGSVSEQVTDKLLKWYMAKDAAAKKVAV